jgi:DNA/RNA-binding domain of Phe-tRNA-synthetase-like protein
VHVEHSGGIWAAFPELVPAVLHATGITPGADVDATVAELTDAARRRLDGSSEAELPEIQAWRRVFSRMGLKPTQYRCASEALLRRLRRDGAVPRIHPLIDLCNAVAMAFAVPVAVFDVRRVEGWLEIRHADGDETYLAFSGEVERPEPGEVIFADAARAAHARRWTNRQSATSAVGEATSEVLVVAEAVHAGAAADVTRLVEVTAGALRAAWSVEPAWAVLRASSPRFVVPGGTA